MTLASFADFFRAVHHKDPFDWQERLAHLAAGGQWPEVLALPTAAGKTSALDAAVYALAIQADRPALERTAPLRIFYVIDRRLVVDEVTEHAERLADALNRAVAGAEGNPVLRLVAERLLSFGGKIPLHVAALRGGTYRDDAWAEAPNQPTVCVSTVDQVGSRLLFRGYGLSEFRQPIHAGLVGSDALFLVDEAHLSVPFCAALEAVARYQGWAQQPVTPPLRVVRLSATPGRAAVTLTLSEQDRTNPILGRRLAASKVAELIEAADFETEAVEQARRLAASPEVQVIGVIANRVASARRIFRALRDAECGEVILVTGRIRPYDRDRLLQRYGERIKADPDRPQRPGEKLYVVCTQTIEVGANVDFDALVTEAAPLSALRQRFGRLDRLGRRGQSQAVVILRKGVRKEDPVYGTQIARTWDWLNRRARLENAGRSQRKVIDFGVNALAPRLDESALTLEDQPEPPVLLPAHVDLWAQTSPPPHPDPDVAPFLHGPGAIDSADVLVVWRADLDPDNSKDWADTVELAPPVVREAMPVPVWAVRAWLRQQEGAGAVADLGVAAGDGAGGGRVVRDPGRPALVWRGPGDERTGVVSPEQIRPGDVVVVPATYGGADEFGWDPGTTGPVQDCADACANEMAIMAAGRRRRQLRLRVHPRMWAATAPPDADGVPLQATEEAWERVHTILTDPEGSDEADLCAAVDDLLQQMPPWLLASELRAAFLMRSGRRHNPYPEGCGLVLTMPVPEEWQQGTKALQSVSAAELAADLTDEDDLPESADGAVTLADHSWGVEAVTRRVARGCGLAPSLCHDIGLAAAVHDLGKLDPRFQVLLHGGNELAAAAATEPLAKSGLPEQPALRRRIREAAGYPRGARHEFQSVALLQSNPAVLAGASDPELVLYLVGTHHGRGRPFPPVVADPSPVDVQAEFRGREMRAASAHGLERLEAGWADLFWRLVRRYGHWGLAYLEAILRLADGARSREERGECG